MPLIFLYYKLHYYEVVLADFGDDKIFTVFYDFLKIDMGHSFEYFDIYLLYEGSYVSLLCFIR